MGTLDDSDMMNGVLQAPFFLVFDTCSYWVLL